MKETRDGPEFQVRIADKIETIKVPKLKKSFCYIYGWIMMVVGFLLAIIPFLKPDINIVFVLVCFFIFSCSVGIGQFIVRYNRLPSTYEF